MGFRGSVHALPTRAPPEAGELRMPPKERLQPDHVELLAQWIRGGLVWKETASPAS